MTNKINYNGLTIEVKEVTPEVAKDILENHNNLNRHRNKAHVKALLNNMKQGTWRFNGDTIRFDKDGELIDGQHRLAALVEFGNPLPMIVISGFDKDTLKTIDQEVKPRNLSDLFKIDGVKEGNNVAAIISRYFVMKSSHTFIDSKRYARSAGSSISSDIRRGFTVDERYNEYYAHTVFYDDVVVYARRAYNRTHLLKLSEIGSIYAYLYFEKHHSDDEIQGFFNRLCFSENDNEVINKFRDKLIRDKDSKTPMMPSYKSALLTKTWNKYIKGESIDVLSYNKKNEGIIEFI